MERNNLFPLNGFAEAEDHGRDFLLLCPRSKISRRIHSDQGKNVYMLALFLMTSSSIRSRNRSFWRTDLCRHISKGLKGREEKRLLLKLHHKPLLTRSCLAFTLITQGLVHDNQCPCSRNNSVGIMGGFIYHGGMPGSQAKTSSLPRS